MSEQPINPGSASVAGSDKYMSHAGTPEDSERNALPPDHIGILVAALLMAVSGWWGLFILVTQTIPRVGQRWLFFMILQIAITGTLLPLVRYINVRFTPIDHEVPPGGVIVRQSMWVALFIVICAWLQIPRVLTWSIAFFLAIVFLVIEIFLRIRERQLEAIDPIEPFVTSTSNSEKSLES